VVERYIFFLQQKKNHVPTLCEARTCIDVRDTTIKNLIVGRIRTSQETIWSFCVKPDLYNFIHSKTAA